MMESDSDMVNSIARSAKPCISEIITKILRHRCDFIAQTRVVLSGRVTARTFCFLCVQRVVDVPLYGHTFHDAQLLQQRLHLCPSFLLSSPGSAASVSCCACLSLSLSSSPGLVCLSCLLQSKGTRARLPLWAEVGVKQRDFPQFTP
ncbi:unnamed protein product [Symbiodinium sp. CCMP2456]|nr:unnamed protein product [Symbiodinium sp. CCMP2456]